MSDMDRLEELFESIRREDVPKDIEDRIRSRVLGRRAAKWLGRSRWLVAAGLLVAIGVAGVFVSTHRDYVAQDSEHPDARAVLRQSMNPHRTGGPGAERLQQRHVQLQSEQDIEWVGSPLDPRHFIQPASR